MEPDNADTQPARVRERETDRQRETERETNRVFALKRFRRNRIGSRGLVLFRLDFELGGGLFCPWRQVT